MAKLSRKQQVSRAEQKYSDLRLYLVAKYVITSGGRNSVCTYIPTNIASANLVISHNKVFFPPHYSNTCAGVLTLYK